MALKKKKYQSGEATNYLTRKQALNKLQLTLKDFRRLCILKGIHPREPKSRKKAQKGNLSKIQTLYYEKDIRFLLHEPIVDKFRDFKVFLKKVKKASDKGNVGTVQRLKANKPKYTLDHIVKERYPSFIDAIRDLEDCLCLCFLFATFPKSSKTPVEMVSLCKRLTVEFMHYIIESKSLRKVFVSIKGYYYQAEILGQTVTWIVPHTFSYDQPDNVDFRLMSIFTEFYTTLLGFVNFRLYHNINLVYPPSLVGAEKTDESLLDRVAALNQSLIKNAVVNDQEEEEAMVIDNIPINGDDETSERMEEIKNEANALNNLKNLFKGCKFFINREVPREPLVFMIRSFGGEVSWDKSVSEAGVTFDETDKKITHQIVDRPKNSFNTSANVIGRDYVQPQWIFDSINQKKLLPSHLYFIGEPLPAHLSPFVVERRVGAYLPPEEKKLLGLEDSNENKEEGNDDNSAEEDEEEEEEDMDEDEDEEEEHKNIKSMGVAVGKTEKENKVEIQKSLESEEFKLREMMIKKKHKGLYKSMMKSRKKREREAEFLTKKRKEYDDKMANEKNSPSIKKKKVSN